MRGTTSQTYHELKTKFEQDIACIIIDDRECFIHTPSEATKHVSVLNKDSFLAQHSDLQYVEVGEDSVRSLHCFVERWLKDDSRRTVAGAVCEPRPKMTGHVNLWRPFRAEQIKTHPQSTAVVNELLAFMQTLVGAEGVLNITNFFAYTVQHPNTRLPYGLAIVGDSWYGRSCFAHFFGRQVIGPYLFQRPLDAAPQTRKGVKFIWADHSVLPETYFGIPSEENTTGARDGEVAWTVPNKANIMATCSVAPASPVFRVIACANMDPPAAIEALMMRPDAGRAFYDYLMSIECPE